MTHFVDGRISRHLIEERKQERSGAIVVLWKLLEDARQAAKSISSQFLEAYSFRRLILASDSLIAAQLVSKQRAGY